MHSEHEQDDQIFSVPIMMLGLVSLRWLTEARICYRMLWLLGTCFSFSN
jgi:hypothetical protein